METDPEPDGPAPAPEWAATVEATAEGTADRTAEGTHAPGSPDDDPQDGDDLPDEDVAHDPLRFQHWRKRSATGAVLSGIALGLQQALEPKRELPAFVMEAPGEPEDPDAPITLHFDPDDPTKTVAVIRPSAIEARRDPPEATDA